VDSDPRAVQAARETGLTCHVDALGHLSDGLPQRYHAVTLSHVIEHCHDPRASLLDAWRLLEPGGVIWIATPNASSVGLRLFRSSWRGLEPPRHMTVLSMMGLRRLIQETGFINIRTPVCPPRASWYFKASRGVEAGSEGQRMPSARDIAVHCIARVADVFGYLFATTREETVIVAEKPANDRDRAPFCAEAVQARVGAPERG
jgi:hypothetical protein